MKKRIEMMSRTTPVRKFLRQRGAAHCEKAQASLAAGVVHAPRMPGTLFASACQIVLWHCICLAGGWLRGRIAEGLHTSNGTRDVSLKGRRV
jgi:hypothetical protein